MRRRPFLLLTACLPASALTFLRANSARATGLPVIDALGIKQITDQIKSTTKQIQETQRQVAYLQNAARKLDPRSYRSIGALLEGDNLTLDDITRDVTNIGYTLNRVDRTFKKMFPEDKDVRKMKASEHAETSRQMNSELYASALVAHRAQTSLSKIEDNNARAKEILQRSEAEDSQVAQLQSATQMLALVHDNLVAITRTVSSASRVSTDIAAAGVTENRLARERRRRSVEGFAKPVETHGIDDAFLRE